MFLAWRRRPRRRKFSVISPNTPVATRRRSHPSAIISTKQKTYPEFRNSGGHSVGWHRPLACAGRRPAARNGEAPELFRTAVFIAMSCLFRPASGRTEQAGRLFHPFYLRNSGLCVLCVFSRLILRKSLKFRPLDYPRRFSGYPARASGYPGRCSGYAGRSSDYPTRGADYPGRGSGFVGRFSGYPA